MTLAPANIPLPQETDTEFALRIIQELYDCGVREWVLCAGKRNATLFALLLEQPLIQYSYWFDERSAAFFALGRARALNAPVAFLTTSGTAAGEPLPAMMEAYYTSVPLIAVTADRPVRFANTGAPQCAEQVGIYGVYAPFHLDLEAGDSFNLANWNQAHPAHLNVRFEEPDQIAHGCADNFKLISNPMRLSQQPKSHDHENLKAFLKSSKKPFVIVSTLLPFSKEAVKRFLLALNAPVYFEAISGLREDPDLECIAIRNCDSIFCTAAQNGYTVDGILRIGGVPTLRLWRDLEDLEGKVNVLSVSPFPFSGLPSSPYVCDDLESYFSVLDVSSIDSREWIHWKNGDRLWTLRLAELLLEEPQSEVSLVHQLSQGIPPDSLLYLGNSLPIREWDLSAAYGIRACHVYANRGVNGIDGQVSTFMGLASSCRSNWGIFGDLTFLYDLSAPAQLCQLKEIALQLVVINNGGGKLFSRFFEQKEFQCTHTYKIKPMAEMWGLAYECWDRTPNCHPTDLTTNRLIEIIPDAEASSRFWAKFKRL